MRTSASLCLNGSLLIIASTSLLLGLSGCSYNRGCVGGQCGPPPGYVSGYRGSAPDMSPPVQGALPTAVYPAETQPGYAVPQGSGSR